MHLAGSRLSGSGVQLVKKATLILGLGRSGLASARYLLAQGKPCILSDQRTEEELLGSGFPFSDLNERYQDILEWALGGHPEALLERCGEVVVSPGVSLHHPLLVEARRREILLLGEMELAWQRCSVPMIAVTGTNGKSTTCSLLGEIFGERSLVGGNIGTPLLDLLESHSGNVEWVVAEVSSFQLETVHKFRPKVAVLTNITPDHLDHHRDLEEYRDAKSRMFAQMGTSDTAIFCADDSEAQGLADLVKEGQLPEWGVGFPSPSRQDPPSILYYSVNGPVPEGLALEDSGDGKRKVIQYRPGHRQELFDWDFPNFVGQAMESNALAAATAALAAGQSVEQIVRSIGSFEHLHYRMEFAGEVQGVRFINDSKATNIAAALAAVDSVSGDVCAIVGGKDKGVDYQPLAEGLAARKAQVFLIGEAAVPIGRCFERLGYEAWRDCGELEHAMVSAIEVLPSGGTVLLAPACSSFDQFRSAEHRGQVFQDTVQRICSAGVIGSLGSRSKVG